MMFKSLNEDCMSDIDVFDHGLIERASRRFSFCSKRWKTTFTDPNECQSKEKRREEAIDFRDLLRNETKLVCVEAEAEAPPSGKRTRTNEPEEDYRTMQVGIYRDSSLDNPFIEPPGKGSPVLREFFIAFTVCPEQEDEQDSRTTKTTRFSGRFVWRPGRRSQMQLLRLRVNDVGRHGASTSKCTPLEKGHNVIKLFLLCTS